MRGLFAVRYGFCVWIFTLMAGCSHFSGGTSTPENAGAEAWWSIPYPKPFNASTLKKQSVLKVDGRFIVDEQGQPFALRGVSIADPDKLVKQKQWRQGLFQEIAQWGANVVRIPIHPIAWRSRGQDAYLAMLDQAVIWANTEGMYLVLDWHSIGHLQTGVFQHPMYETDRAETFQFWRIVASRYAEVPTVAVYELFNEPTTAGGAYGRADWHTWKALNEALIDIIRAVDPTAIPLVAGFNWAYDLSRISRHPIERPGIAYAIHPYPQKENPQTRTQQQFFKLWQENWGHLADTYPLLATEIGWVRPGGDGAHVPVIDDGSYGPNIVRFLEERNIGWMAWCFDPDWAPTLIEDWSYAPTEQGAWFKKVMLGEQAESDR